MTAPEYRPPAPPPPPRPSGLRVEIVDAPEPLLKDPALQDRVRYLGDVQRLRLKHDDVIVVSTDQYLNQAQVEQIKRVVAQVLGSQRKVLVLSCGMRIGVIAPEEP